VDASARSSAPAGFPGGSGTVRPTVTQERALVIAAEAGDREAAGALIQTFLPEIHALARRFRHSPGVEYADLVQEGVTALLFAARRYDTRLETPFWAYAAFWVRKAMQELVADLSRAVALSDRAARSLAALRTARSEFQVAHGREPTVPELAEAAGQPRAQVERLLAADATAHSLDSAGGPDGVGRLGDQLRDPQAEEAYDAVLDGIELAEVRPLWESLSERELFVLRAHFGVGRPAQNLGQIGAALGLSAERARQIEAAALGRVRAQLAARARPQAAP
jgi:RNA polymerase sigma factor (sigma-70 family)